MPKVREAPSLRQSCLEQISEKIEEVCYGLGTGEVTIFLENVDPETVDIDSLPVASLPAHLLTEIFDTASRL